MRSRAKNTFFLVLLFSVSTVKAQTTDVKLQEKKAVIATPVLSPAPINEPSVDVINSVTSGSQENPVSIQQIKKDKEEYIKLKQKDALLKGKAALEKEIELNASNPEYNLEENLKRLKLIENHILTNYN